MNGLLSVVVIVEVGRETCLYSGTIILDGASMGIVEMKAQAPAPESACGQRESEGIGYVWSRRRHRPVEHRKPERQTIGFKDDPPVGVGGRDVEEAFRNDGKVV